MVSLGQKLKVEGMIGTSERKVMIPILIFLLVQFLFSSGNHLSLTLNEDPRNEMGSP